MTLRLYLSLMSLATLACWSIFVFIINIINPETTNLFGFISFYFSLSLSLIGTSTILGFFIRFILLKQNLAFRVVAETFRQSFLFTLFIITSLILLSRDIFDWINLVMLISVLSMIEFFILGYSKEPRKINSTMEENQI
ncbi:MAG: hypothetical protein NT091_04360 [Candidatus Falkowbacteria bacterium]|nr:hypothetical protein [Candidatus Falkowbacteria bacterium]